MNRRFTILSTSLLVLLCVLGSEPEVASGQSLTASATAAAKDLPAAQNGTQTQQSGRPSATQTQSSGNDMPDLSGVWSAPFVPDLATALGHQPPFTPYGADRFAKVDHLQEPMAKCLPMGPARGIQAGLMPFQLVQSRGVIAILFENQHAFRIVYMDGRKYNDDMDPSFWGDSIGHFEGNTLVVDTANMNDRTWLDTAGHEHSDQLHMIERFEKIDANNIKWTVTFDDPKFFTQPWSVTLPIKRQNTVLMDYSCEDNEKDLVHMQPTLINK